MIHPTAVIESGAQLGENVQIGPHAFVAASARLGDGCHLGPNAVVLSHTTLGANCRVHAGAVIGDVPQDLSFREEPSFVVAGEGCTFREGVTVHRGTTPGTTTRLGNHVYLMANAHVAHNCILGDHVIMANNVLLAGHVTIGERAFLSGFVGVHQFCHVGRLSMVAGAAVITKDLPPFCLTPNNRHNEVGGLNLVGLRRAGFDAGQRAQIKQAFHILYRSGLNTTQAAERLRAETDNPFAAEYADFLAQAKRGICRPSFGTAGDEADA